MNGYSRNAAEIHNFGGIFIACFVVVVYVCVCLRVCFCVRVCSRFLIEGETKFATFPRRYFKALGFL